MTLVVCPGCGRSYPAVAAACSICGRPTDSVATAPRAPNAAPGVGAYAPPTGYTFVLGGGDSRPAESTGTREHAFFPVAFHKFIILSICTLGIYQLYWCYKNWVRVEQRAHEGITPLLRAIFSVLFAFSLFERIHDDAERRKVAASWKPWLLGALFFALSVAGRLPKPWWLISLASFAPFLPVVRTIESINAGEEADEGRNGAYSGWNILVIALGALITLLAIIGTLAPDASQAQ